MTYRDTMVSNKDDVRVTLRIPPDLHARLMAEATRERRSLNSQIVIELEELFPAGATPIEVKSKMADGGEMKVTIGSPGPD